jgi:hypothetical protein
VPYHLLNFIESWEEKGQNLTQEDIRLKILENTWKYLELSPDIYNKGVVISRRNGK